MAKLKILISGGGVAGTSLAFWLAHLNHDVTVVEHFPTLRTTGLQIDLRGDGIKVLKRMGLEKAFREKAAPEEGIQFIDSAGRKRAYMPANRSGKGPQGVTSDYEIMRGDLCRLIHDATGESAKYVFGTSIASLEQVDGGVGVTFKTGKTERYDLLVGCDGAFSATRKMMLGAKDALAGFTPLGDYNAYLTFKKPIEAGEKYVGTMYTAPGKRTLLTRRHNAEEMQLYLLVSKQYEQLQDVRRGDVEAEKKAFADIFKDAGWKTPELLQYMQDSDDFYCERIGLVRLDSWSQGHVALLGDAASAPGGSGMGTTCAVVGAYVLAGEIGKHCGRGDSREPATSADAAQDNVLSALQGFESSFRPFMDHVQRGLEEPPSWLIPETAWGIEVMHWVLQVIVGLMWIAPFASYFVKENIKNWTLPEYEVLPAVEGEKNAQS